MATKKADQKAKQQANQTALKHFPKAKLRSALDKMADAKTTEGAAKDAGAGASLDFCRAAQTFREENSEVDVATVVTGWRENLAVLVMALATEGHLLAELKPGKDDKPATAKLTGTGNNVASIAKGVIEFELNIDEDCKTKDQDGQEIVSYRGVRSKVEEIRSEVRRERDPDGAALADAKEACDSAWSELKTLIYSTNDVGLVRGLKDALDRMRAEADEQLKAQAEADEQEAEQEAKAA